MSKIITGYDLSDPISFKDLISDCNKILKDIQINFHCNENAIEASHRGKPFDTARCEHPTIDDRVLIDPAVHGNIDNRELYLMGAVFQINSIGNQYPGSNTSNYPLLGDYIMWTAFSPDPIMVQFDIPGDELSNVIPDPVKRHAATLQQLKLDKNIQIIDDGFSSSAYIFYLQNPSTPMVKKFVGTITVILNIGFPKKVNDIVDAVKTFKSELYQTVDTMYSTSNNTQ